MLRRLRRIPKTAAVPICLFLAACGGGSGGGESDRAETSPAPSPVISQPSDGAPAPAPTPEPNQPGDGTSTPTPVPTPSPSIPGDPYYSLQWQLKSTGQTGNYGAVARVGEDINVEPVWASCGDNGTCKGEGINIAVVDSGIEIRHPDLQQNISSTLQHRIYPFPWGDPHNGDPTPPRNDTTVIDGAYVSDHGTQMAGIIAARDNNGIGVRGVAPRASLVSYGLLQNINSTFDLVDSMTFQAPSIHVSNNSWGINGDLAQLYEPSGLWAQAIDQGLTVGRSGRGTVYVFAGGNDRSYKARTDYSGYTNYKGVITVGATNHLGQPARYSTPGASLWISAPAGDGCDLLGMLTTDLTGDAGTNNPSMQNQYDMVGVGDYTQCSGGTSGATAMVSGVAALVVQANPALGWRDVKAILAQTARRNDPTNPSWSRNAAGYWINDNFGFGVVDAAAAVSAAKSWTNLPAQRTYSSPTHTVNLPIPDNSTAGITTNVSVTNSGINKIEWVDLTITAPHAYSGDLQIILTSPSGTESVLAETRDCRQRSGLGSTVSSTCAPYNRWRFGVARFLGENADGNWRISVKDGKTGNLGSLDSVQLSLYGH